MYSYLIVLLAFLSASSNAFDCLHHLCSTAFKVCNHTAESQDDTNECWEWADDTFHCCQECEKCDTATATATDECNAQFCDKVFGVCNRLHPNDTDCQEIADEASHCCYSCLSCSSSSHTKSPPAMCHDKLCFDVFKACRDSDNPHIECMQMADEASGCCDVCDACPLECNEDMCYKIFDRCTQNHPNSSDCCERADSATHCCNNCLECSTNVKPPTPRYDHCLKDLCNDVYLHCIDAEHSSDMCRSMANHASECCNMCTDCSQ